jgi:hypothetical protein
VSLCRAVAWPRTGWLSDLLRMARRVAGVDSADQPGHLLPRRQPALTPLGGTTALAWPCSSPRYGDATPCGSQDIDELSARDRRGHQGQELASLLVCARRLLLLLGDLLCPLCPETIQSALNVLRGLGRHDTQETTLGEGALHRASESCMRSAGLFMGAKSLGTSLSKRLPIGRGIAASPGGSRRPIPCWTDLPIGGPRGSSGVRGRGRRHSAARHSLRVSFARP